MKSIIFGWLNPNSITIFWDKTCQKNAILGEISRQRGQTQQDCRIQTLQFFMNFPSCRQVEWVRNTAVQKIWQKLRALTQKCWPSSRGNEHVVVGAPLEMLRRHAKIWGGWNVVDFPSSTGIHNFMLALNSTIVLNKNMIPQHTCCLQTKPAMNANTICLDFHCYLLDLSSILSGWTSHLLIFWERHRKMAQWKPQEKQSCPSQHFPRGKASMTWAMMIMIIFFRCTELPHNFGPITRFPFSESSIVAQKQYKTIESPCSSWYFLVFFGISW